MTELRNMLCGVSEWYKWCIADKFHCSRLMKAGLLLGLSTSPTASHASKKYFAL
jgi:hypothetical protein